MMRPQWVAFGIVLALVWSAMALATESSMLFVLDGSESMPAKLNGRLKIEHARPLLSQLIKSLPSGIYIGLATLDHMSKDDGSDIEMLTSVGNAHTAAIKAMESIHPKGTTPLMGAMQVAAAQFREHAGDAKVVVISDGKETYTGNPFAAAREACAAGVNMQGHVIGCDVPPEETKQLRYIAEVRDGKYFVAKHAPELGKALTQVKQEVVAVAVREQVAQAQPPAKPSPAKPKRQVLFEDKFNRDTLGELYEVLDPDSNRLTLNDGKLVIVATNPVKNRVLLEKTFSGDFVATVRMNMQVTAGNAAGLYYWVDVDNLLSFRVYGRETEARGPLIIRLKGDVDARVPIFVKVVSGETNVIQWSTLQLGKRNLEGYSREPELWYFQLERKGVNYTARLSVDGSQWTTVGTHTFLPKGGRLGFGATSGQNGIENAAEFGAFVVQGGE
jgi:hypothetical protein